MIIFLIIILDVLHKNYIHHFSYINEENTKDINDLLWQEIYQSILQKENNEIYDKENIVENKEL